MDTRDMLIEAPHRQGGHSPRGRELAQKLKVPFPITMQDLEKRARQLSFDPNEIWPWYKKETE